MLRWGLATAPVLTVTYPENALSVLTLPNLVIAGVARGGTTSLFSYLGAHPDICPARRKETEYFSPLHNGGMLAPQEDYAGNFSHCTNQRYRMEATPGYMFGGETIARAIDETLPEARIIIMLRDPIARASSFFTYYKSRFGIPKEMSFPEYITACRERGSLDNAARAISPEYGALHSGLYAEFITPWFDVFNGRLLITFSDQLHDKHKLMTQLCDWLSLDSAAVDWEQLRIFNPSAMYRGALLHRMALQINQAAEPFFRRHAKLKECLTRFYQRVNAAETQEPVDPAMLDELKAFFDPHNKRLAKILHDHGYDELPAWLEEMDSSAASE